MSSRSPDAQLQQRPALVVFICLAAGIELSRLVGSSFLLLAVGCGLACIASASFLRRLPIARFVVVALTSICLGYVGMSTSDASESEHIIPTIARLHHRSAVIYGTVSSIDAASMPQRVVLEADSLVVDSVVFHTRQEAVLLNVSHRSDTMNIPMSVGEQVKVYCDLESLDDARNPYDNYASSLKRRWGVSASASVGSPYDIYVLGHSNESSILENVSNVFYAIRSSAKERIAGAIEDTSAAGVVEAVVLGEREGLDRDTYTAFQRAGLAHILVVSGFNIAIVAALIYYLLRLFGVYRVRWRTVCTMIGVACYAGIVGLEPSVFRAALAVELVLLARLIERKPDICNITAAVASLALIIDPAVLFEASFELTYGAVFALTLIYPKISERIISGEVPESLFERAKRFLTTTFLTSFSVTIGLIPVMLIQFHHLTIVGVVTNLVGIPLSTILTVVGFLLIPISFFGHTIAVAYGDIAALLSDTLVRFAHLGGSIRGSSILLPRPSVVALMLYYVGLAYLIGSATWRRFRVRVLISCCALYAVSMSGITLSSSIMRSPDKLSVLFFDVGQGDAALVSTPNNKNYLIDFGGIRSSGEFVSSGTIDPLIETEALAPIEAGFISHMHLDHFSGAIDMLSQGYIEKLYTSGERSGSVVAYRLDSLVHEHRIPVSSLRRGQTITLDSDVTLYVLNPDEALPVGQREMNHHSLVFKLCYGSSSVLFLGDIESSDEESLAMRYGDFLKSDIVKVAHHGSKYSSTRSFAKCVSPSYAVVSVGEHNTFGHPSKEALHAWYDVGAMLHRTDLEGAQLFRSDGAGFTSVDWKNE